MVLSIFLTLHACCFLPPGKQCERPRLLCGPSPVTLLSLASSASIPRQPGDCFVCSHPPLLVHLQASPKGTPSPTSCTRRPLGDPAQLTPEQVALSWDGQVEAAPPPSLPQCQRVHTAASVISWGAQRHQRAAAPPPPMSTDEQNRDESPTRETAPFQRSIKLFQRG